MKQNQKTKDQKQENQPQKRVGITEAVTCLKIVKSLYDLIKMLIKRKNKKEQDKADDIKESLQESYDKIDKENEKQKEKEDIESVKDDLNNMF